SLALAPEGRRLAIAYRAYTAEVWDLEQMRRIGEPLTANNGWVWHATFSHDGRWLATSSGGNATQLRDALNPGNKPLRAYTHGGGVHKACFSSGDRLMLTLAEDHAARIWDRETGKALTEPLEFEDHFVRDGGFGPDDREVLAAGEKGAVIWDVKTGSA